MFLSSQDLQIIRYKAITELKAESTKTKLSVAWWFLDPILSMTIYYLVFGILLDRYGVEFIPSLLLGLIMFNWFRTCFNGCINSINGNRQLVTNLCFNKAILPSVKIASNTFKSALVITLLLPFLWYVGHTPSLTYLYLPLVFLAQALMILSTGYLISGIIPFIPDIKNLASHAIRVLTYISGVLYPLSAVPTEYQDLFLMNPLAFLVESYRKIIIEQSPPDLAHLFWLSFFFIGLLGLSMLYLKRLNNHFPRLLIQR